MAKEWTRENTTLLISLWEGIPLLWDISEADYKNRTKRTSAIEQLAQQLNTDAGEVNRKIHNMRTQFNNELRKTRKRKSGQGSAELYVSKWEWFNALQFLLPSSKCAETQSNYESREENLNLESAEAPPNDTRKKVYKLLKIHKEDDVLNKALEIMNDKKAPDDDAQILGNFVAATFRNLRTQEYQRQLKRKIQAAILEYEELDDATWCATDGDISATFMHL